MCTFTSRYFGTLDYEPGTDLLTFPRGLAGFEDHHNWILLDGKTGSIKWLQNIEDPALALPVTAPDAVRPDYEARISDDDLQAVGVKDWDSDGLVMLVVLTIPQTAPCDMTAGSLGITKVNVATREAASRAIGQLDAAINKVSAQRAKIGAYQNSLEYTIENLQTTATNLTAAESRIRDADMAKTMMEFVKLQILNQSGTSMLAQANQLPQQVLSLLQ